MGANPKDVAEETEALKDFLEIRKTTGNTSSLDQLTARVAVKLYGERAALSRLMSSTGYQGLDMDEVVLEDLKERLERVGILTLEEYMLLCVLEYRMF